MAGRSRCVFCGADSGAIRDMNVSKYSARRALEASVFES